MRRDIKVALAIGVVFIAVVGTIGFLRGGLDPMDIVFALVVLFLLADRVNMNERFEDTRADVDDLGRDIDDIKLELSGDDKPSTGRHAPVRNPSTNPIPKQ